MKKIVTTLSLVITVGLLYLWSNFYFKPKQSDTNKNSKWTTFQKNSTNSKVISKHSTTTTEFDTLRIKETKKQGRKPASIEQETYEGRILKGIKSFNIDDYPKGFTNYPNNDWKELLAKNLIKFQDPSVKLFIKEESKMIGLKNYRPIYLESVLISYLFPDGRRNSFRAIVDAEHGNVISTWNKTKREDFGPGHQHKKHGIKVAPIEHF